MKSTERVRAALIEQGVGDVIVHLPDSARTAQMAADAISKHFRIDVSVGAIVKSLIFLADAQPVLALIAGDRRGSRNKLKVTLDAAQVQIADAESVRAATGYAIGGVPPLAHATPLPVLIDQSLGRFETVYASAGHPHTIFPIAFAQLVAVTQGRVVDIADEQ
jgi:prolyl-tRNA editing enzyme YbaK/EbsC (Cys-tRNA(Pro) deacylase)